MPSRQILVGIGTNSALSIRHWRWEGQVKAVFLLAKTLYIQQLPDHILSPGSQISGMVLVTDSLPNGLSKPSRAVQCLTNRRSGIGRGEGRDSSKTPSSECSRTEALAPSRAIKWLVPFLDVEGSQPYPRLPLRADRSSNKDHLRLLIQFTGPVRHQCCIDHDPCLLLRLPKFAPHNIYYSE